MLPNVEQQFFNSLQPADRFVVSRVRMKNCFLSRKRKKGITARSLLPQIASSWALLSDIEKDAWSSAGVVCGLNGWRLFVKDQTLRIINDMSGVAVPSLLHQASVGRLHIEGDAKEIEIVQTHPSSYYVSQKIKGTKSQYAPVKINEAIALPLVLSLNYNADLVSASFDSAYFGIGNFGVLEFGYIDNFVNSYAQFYLKVWYSYQGVNLTHYEKIDLDFQTAWKSATKTLSTLDTIIVRYDIIFKLYNLQGDLYFDIIKIEHSGQNWCRDSFCDDIDQNFTRAFYQIPKHWAPVILPFGANFGSLYKDFDN